MTTALLEIENLTVHFRTEQGINRAVDGITFHVSEGETLAIVGESGCGKSVTAMSMLRLIPDGHAMVRGRIAFQRQDILAMQHKELRKIRGNSISIIFQEPMTSLNPVLTIGKQLREVLQLHQGLSQREAQQQAVQMLQMVGIPSAAQYVEKYPHQLSGGMRQRVMIATALSCRPKLLIADEPTTALDVTIQAQILDLMQDLKQRTNTAIVLITHDLGVVAEMADRVIVMYAGKKVEQACVSDLFENPKHPYTKGLLGAMPVLGSSASGATDRLTEIPGTVTAVMEDRPGCHFARRCQFATDVCHAVTPTLQVDGAGHEVACHLAAPRSGVA